MSEEIKYPYIGQGKYSDAVFLFTSKGAALTMQQGEFSDYSTFETGINEGFCADITQEFLQETWGVVESKEHAEFIIELAENAGLELARISCNHGNFFAIDTEKLIFLNIESIARGGCKQITIPLPPKAKKWTPEVGDEVCWGSDRGGVVKSLSDGLAWIKESKDKQYTTVYVSSLKKPKSAQELKIDELQTKLCENDAVDNYILACDIVMGNIEGLSYDRAD